LPFVLAAQAAIVEDDNLIHKEGFKENSGIKSGEFIAGALSERE